MAAHVSGGVHSTSFTAKVCEKAAKRHEYHSSRRTPGNQVISAWPTHPSNSSTFRVFCTHPFRSFLVSAVLCGVCTAEVQRLQSLCC